MQNIAQCLRLLLNKKKEVNSLQETLYDKKEMYDEALEGVDEAIRLK